MTREALNLASLKLLLGARTSSDELAVRTRLRV